MEIFGGCISAENCIMKKILPLVLIVIGITSNAQSEKKPPPPPLPKIIDEKVKISAPKVVYKVAEPPVIIAKGEMADEFYKRNPSISEISRKENVITLKKKDGAIEKYDMSKKEEDKSFTDKYGRSPIPPPPPKPKEVVKYKVVDEKVKVSPPPPKKIS
jgi:hypothetical protein